MKIYSMLVILISCNWIVGLATDANAGFSAGLPSSHMIANVPWHQQMNGLFCGEGILEGVYDYYGPDINQKEGSSLISVGSQVSLYTNSY
ncbi:MAG: hypothetical protein ACYDHX_14220 [Methanothrix sp.]